MITIKNLLSKTTAIIFPGGAIILQRSVQNKETHLRGTSDITKVKPNFPFCLDSLFEDYLSYDPYLCSLWSNKGRKKLNTYISSLLSCSLLWDLQPRNPELFPLIFSNKMKNSRSLLCLPLWMIPISKNHLYVRVRSCGTDGQRDMILIQIITNALLYKHTSFIQQSAGFESKTRICCRSFFMWVWNKSALETNMKICLFFFLLCFFFPIAMSLLITTESTVQLKDAL